MPSKLNKITINLVQIIHFLLVFQLENVQKEKKNNLHLIFQHVFFVQKVIINLKIKKVF